MFDLYVSIAGFTIRLRFGEIHYYDYPKRQLIHNIKHMYRGFFIPQTAVSSVDHTIFVFDNTTYRILGRNKNTKEYIQYYHTISKTQTETWYHVSSFQFATVMKKVVDRLLSQHHGFVLHAS